MNAAGKNLAMSGAGPSNRVLRLLAAVLVALCLAAGSQAVAPEGTSSVDLTVHEWGTFTSIAGNEGHAVEWMPLTGSTDLPAFVEHFRDASFKLGLRGTVRMETPVLYFHSSQDAIVSVKVAFSRGIITDWYPRATRIVPSGTLNDWTLSQRQADGTIAWDAVTVSPNLAADFPREAGENHYYRARETTAAPLRVQTSAGEEQEKFLFYRGVSVYPLTLSAKLNADGKLIITNLGEEQIPAIILFEHRGERVGYQMVGPLQNETMLAPPELNGSVDSLCANLEGILVAQGLYTDEAHAMVETWRYSWFEEGSRLLYIVPVGFLDKVLPLSVRPRPTNTVRVFVGRLEIVTAATAIEVERALYRNDTVTLEQYGRFLEPILRTMIEKEPDANRAKQLSRYLNSHYNSQLMRVGVGRAY